MTDGAGQLSFTTAIPGILPVGSVLPFAGVTAPSGFVLCYGQQLNTYDYRVLHAVVSDTYGGTAYNAGVTDQSGVTTQFNVPDLRGRVVAGQDDMGGASADRLTSNPNGDTLGASGGSEDHTLTLNQLPDSYYYNSNLRQKDDYVDNYAGFNYTPRVADTTSHTTQGGGNAHNNVQPTLILNYIIKV